jgi:hypothetical protein
VNKKTCSFCEAALTNASRANEHVIPEWLLNLLEIKRDERHIGSRKLPGGELVAEREFGARDIKYGLVCKGCNSGWLSRLETATKQIFLRLFVMGPLSLAQEDCALLAFWAYKTAVLLALTADESRKSLVRPSLLPELYRNQRMPDTADVALLLAIPAPDRKAQTIIHQPEFIDQGPVSASRQQFADLARESNGYVSILQFGHVALRVIDIGPRHRWKILDMKSAPQVRLGSVQESVRPPWPPKVWLNKPIIEFASDIKFSLRRV